MYRIFNFKGDKTQVNKHIQECGTYVYIIYVRRYIRDMEKRQEQDTKVDNQRC